ncbi:MAG: hypothetical protein N2169_04495 [bacterium]|nr:hypothetical protein [bacterium]
MGQSNYKANYVFGNIIDEVFSDDLNYIFSLAKSKRKEMLKNSIHDIVKVIDRVSNFWLDENNQFYPLVLRNLNNLGFSQEMLKLAIRELSRIFTYETLVKRICIELGSLEILDGWKGEDIKLRAFPLGVLTHVTAGNVFVSSIDSLLCGVIAKNINIVKTSSKVGNFFGILWVESLRKIEEELGMKGIISENIVVFSYNSDDLISYLNRYSDGLVVWGSYETIKFFGSNFDPKKKLIMYGPKYSVCVLDDISLSENIDNESFYRSLAWDICLWEQRACSSVQTIYVVGNVDYDLLEVFANRLSDSVKNFEIEQGELSFDEYTEIFKYEEIALANTVLKNGKYFERVYLDYSSGGFFVGPLNRFICIKRVSNLEELIGLLLPYSEILQSCSIKVKDIELYVNELAGCGITRFVNLGNIGFNEVFVPHEGEYILRKFCKLISRA